MVIKDWIGGVIVIIGLITLLFVIASCSAKSLLLGGGQEIRHGIVCVEEKVSLSKCKEALEDVK